MLRYVINLGEPPLWFKNMIEKWVKLSINGILITKVALMVKPTP
jgi:hypothetical protein